MRIRPLLISALTAALLVSACAQPPAFREPAPAAPACTDSIYLRLRHEHPDSLSDRAWERLQQLEAACERQRSAAADRGEAPAGVAHHGAGWLWMPAMMGLGTLMWLMMAGGA